MDERDVRHLREHVQTLRVQAKFAVSAARKAADVLERTLAADPTAKDIDRSRSQTRAAMRALRLTNQLLAQAAELMEPTATGGSDDRRRRSARVG